MTENPKRRLFQLFLGGMLLVAAVAAISIYQAKFSGAAYLENLPNLDLSAVEENVALRIDSLRSDVKQAPKSAEAWGNLAMILHVHDLKSESVPCYKVAADLNPEEFRWPYYCATVLSNLASDDAFQWFERAHTLRPDYTPLNITYGRVLFDSGEIEAAREAFTRVLSSDPLNAHANVGLAKIELTNGRPEKSQRLLDRALEQNPRHREARSILAELYRRQGDSEKASAEMQTAQKLPEAPPMEDPVYEELLSLGLSATWYRDRGLAYQTQGLIDEAVREFEKALQLKPDPTGYHYLGNLLRTHGKHEQAVKHYLTALDLNPSYYDALNHLALTLFELGQVDEAIQWGERSMRVNPNLPDAYLNLGLFYARVGETGRAIQVLRQGLRRTRSYPPVAIHLARLLASSREAEHRNGREAVRLAEYVNEKPNFKNAESLDVLAIAYAETGQFAKAQKTAREALQQKGVDRQPALRKGISERLALFESHLPYRDRRTATKDRESERERE
ncbi:tetratricopeptide repeat protein [bacterium]|nr:tetratricopeptide repeat protein [bacterium]